MSVWMLDRSVKPVAFFPPPTVKKPSTYLRQHKEVQFYMKNHTQRAKAVSNHNLQLWQPLSHIVLMEGIWLLWKCFYIQQWEMYVIALQGWVETE